MLTVVPFVDDVMERRSVSPITDDDSSIAGVDSRREKGFELGDALHVSMDQIGNFCWDMFVVTEIKSTTIEAVSSDKQLKIEFELSGDRVESVVYTGENGIEYPKMQRKNGAFYAEDDQNPITIFVKHVLDRVDIEKFSTQYEQICTTRSDANIVCMLRFDEVDTETATETSDRVAARMDECGYTLKKRELELVCNDHVTNLARMDIKLADQGELTYVSDDSCMHIGGCRVYHSPENPFNVIAIGIGPLDNEMLFIRSGSAGSGVFFDQSISAQLMSLEIY
jgi:hypothetical protein